MATIAERQLWARSQALGDTSPHSNPSWLSRLHDPSAGTGWVNYSLRGIYKCLQMRKLRVKKLHILLRFHV